MELQPDTSRANARPFVNSFRVAMIVAVLAAVALFFAIDSPTEPSERFGRILGGLMPGLLIAALIAGFAARRSRKTWSSWRYAALVVPVAFLLLILSAAGRVNASHEWTDADRAGFVRAAEAQGVDPEMARCVLCETETAYPDPQKAPDPTSAEFKVFANGAIITCSGSDN